MDLSARLDALEAAVLALGRAEFGSPDQPRADNGRWISISAYTSFYDVDKGGPSHFQVSGPPHPTREAAQAMAAEFPKGARMAVYKTSEMDGSLTHTFGTSGNLRSNEVNGGVNEAGLKRYDAVIKGAEKAGIEVRWNAGTAVNAYSTRDDFERAVGRAAAALLEFGGKGNPDALRHWYADDPQDRFDWGNPGDFMKCVDKASEYMTDDEAKGFCNLRHKEATGHYPGEKNAHG